VLDALALYGRYLGISARAQLQYRASFVLQSMGQFLVTGIEFLAVWALFERFGGLGSWELAEVAFFYGTVNVAFALADSLSTGLDHLGDLVKRGEFDRILLRPRSTVLQLAAYELALRRIGRLAQGLVVLWIADHALAVDWTLAKVLLLSGTLFGGVCLFFGLFLLQATLAFWTTETLELMNTLTYGGVETAQYPLAIYAAWFRRVFTFVVPLAAIAYFPVVALLERPDPLGSPLWFQQAAPLLGPLFLLAALAFFHLGLRHYKSTGS
jgi:ABC-2 type transport system permease protein